MEIPIIPRKPGKDFVKYLFVVLKTSTQPKKTGAYLDRLGTFQEFVSRAQLKDIYSYEGSCNKHINVGLAFALAGVETRRAVGILSSLTYDRHKEVRHWATHALVHHSKMRSRIVNDALWDRLRDRNEQISKMALLGLARRRDSRVGAFIIAKLMKDGPSDNLLEVIYETGRIDILTSIKRQHRIRATGKLVNYILLAALKDALLTQKQ